MRYILKKISKKYIVYLCVLILIIIISRLFPIYDTDIINLNEKFLKISGKHILGTDYLGRDICSLMIKGGIRTLEVIVIASSFSFTTGIFAGMITGYTDSPLNVIPDFLIDLFMIIPTFILALVITSQFGLTPLNAGLSIGIGSIGGYYNQTKKLVQEIKKKEFVVASRMLGAGNGRIIFRHILPNIIKPVFTSLGNNMSGISLQYASLTFIGLGSDINNPDWGTMLYQYRIYLFDYPMMLLWPSLGIFLIAFVSNRLFDDREINNIKQGTIYD